MKLSIQQKINYKIFLVIPIAILIFSIYILVNQYNQTGEYFTRSIELKGGTLITVTTTKPIDINLVEKSLEAKFGPVIVRKLSSFGEYGSTIEVGEGVNSSLVFAELSKLNINVTQSSVESIGPALGSTFWQQAQIGIIVAFIFMAIIVFIVFRTLIPSFAVILAAVSDIIATLAFMQVFGIELSLACLAALLMLIGYSVDTDILLTTRVIRTQEGSISERVRGAFKTGITMSLTTLGALSALFLLSISPVLTQIASVLIIGLIIDLPNTWITNAYLLEWYVKRKEVLG